MFASVGARFGYEMQTGEPIVSVLMTVSSFTGRALPSAVAVHAAEDVSSAAGDIEGAAETRITVVDGKIQRTEKV